MQSVWTKTPLSSVKRMLYQLKRSYETMFSSYAVILLYHRVSDSSLDPLQLSVSSQNFIDHMKIITELGLPTTVSNVASGRFPKGAIGVTFDDGYADNLYNAKPVLQGLNIPATVFVTTAYLNAGKPFWWDTLEQIFLHPNRLPSKLKVDVAGETIHEDLENDAEYSEMQANRYQAWSVEEKTMPSKRQVLYKKFWSLMNALDTAQRSEVIDNLCRWANFEPRVKEKYRVMSERELLELIKGGNVEVGSHTVNHPRLSLLNSAKQQYEVEHSQKELNRILKRPIQGFAYPFGTSRDYNAETIRLVKNGGYKWACSNFKGRVWRSTPKYQLPRMLVRNWDAESFREKLNRWLTE